MNTINRARCIVSLSKAAAIRDVPLDASFICDKAVVLRNSTKETPCTIKKKLRRPHLLQTFDIGSGY
jgi:hypothetical protein